MLLTASRGILGTLGGRQANHEFGEIKTERNHGCANFHVEHCPKHLPVELADLPFARAQRLLPVASVLHSNHAWEPEVTQYPEHNLVAVLVTDTHSRQTN